MRTETDGNKTIGIIGGMGPMATVQLFHKIVAMTQSETDMGHLHILIDDNTKIPDRTDAILHEGDDPVPEMVRSAFRLEQSGADILIMSCNTAHYFYPEICRFVHIPFLNMIWETAKEAKRQGFCRAGLLATDGTISTGIYEREFKRYGLELTLPDGPKQKAVMNLIYQGVKSGADEWDTAPIERIVEHMKENGAQTVILGCTELPLAFSKYHIRSGLPVIDPTEILAKQAILAAGGNLRPEYK